MQPSTLKIELTQYQDVFGGLRLGSWPAPTVQAGLFSFKRQILQVFRVSTYPTISLRHCLGGLDGLGGLASWYCTCCSAFNDVIFVSRYSKCFIICSNSASNPWVFCWDNGFLMNHVCIFYPFLHGIKCKGTLCISRTFDGIIKCGWLAFE